MLRPAIAFSDCRVDAVWRRALMPERLDEETGPQSRTVTHRLLLACAGWTATPSGRVLRRAAHRRAHRAPALHRARLVAGGHQRRALARAHRGRLQLAATGGRHPDVWHRALPAVPPDQRAEHAMSADWPSHDERGDAHEDEVLELAGAPRELVARTHRSPMGGRESRDIDIVIRASTRRGVREALDTAASGAGGYRVEGPEIDRIEFPTRRAKKTGVTRVAHEPLRPTQHHFGRRQGPLRQEALGANRTARAATPQERLAAVPILTDRHARCTQSAAAEHATRASSAVREADRRPMKIARGATTRAQPSVRVRGSFTQGPSRSPRLARVRRPAPRHRARRDANRGSLTRIGPQEGPAVFAITRAAK